MAEWPKEIVIRGIAIRVNSWDEFDEVVARYGTSDGSPGRSSFTPLGPQGPVQLTASDRTMLQQFLQNGRRGLLNSELSGPLGAEGTSIKPALDAWSRRIGLTNSEGGSAFESFNMGRSGRGYRLTVIAAGAARTLLGMEGGAG